MTEEHNEANCRFQAKNDHFAQAYGRPTPTVERFNITCKIRGHDEHCPFYKRSPIIPDETYLIKKTLQDVLVTIQTNKVYIAQARYAEIEKRVLAKLNSEGIVIDRILFDDLIFKSPEDFRRFQEEIEKEMKDKK